MLMFLHLSKRVENLTKTDEQLPPYQVLLVLKLAASALSNAVSHIGARKALIVRRLTRLIR